jgi:hypothetical protein
VSDSDILNIWQCLVEELNASVLGISSGEGCHCWYLKWVRVRNKIDSVILKSR